MNKLSQTVTRALGLLTYFTETSPEWTATELARQAGLPQSTVHRLLTTLEHLDFVVRSGDSARFGLGPALLPLAGVALARMELYRSSVGAVGDLAVRTGLSATLATRYRDWAMYLVRVEPRPVDSVHAVGKLVPLHCTAVGKIVLATLPTAEMSQVVDRIELRPYTSNTITDKNRLLLELERVRSEGVAFDFHEFAPQSRAVAVPVYGPGNQAVGAVSLSDTTGGISDENRGDLVRVLRTCANAIGLALGNRFIMA